jgi:hypothetical protein
MGDDITRRIIMNVTPSLNPGEISGGSDIHHDFPNEDIEFIYCCVQLVNQTYLQLETLLTQISLRFRLEDSKRLFIYTTLFNARTARII